MKTKPQPRLWRVSWIHRDGYQAPYMLVEAETKKEAHSKVMKSGHTLFRFRESWSFTLTDTMRELVNGKWI